MATSGSTDFALNSRQIVTAALQLCGARALGDTPSSEEAALGLLHLNLLLKTWSTDPRIFLIAQASQVMTASVASYSLAAARRVIEVRKRDTAGRDTPLGELDRSQYTMLPNKAAVGSPASYFFDPQRATRTLYIWYAPDAAAAANFTLQYTYQRVIEDSDALDNDPDVPQEWLEALTYSLSARLTIPLKRHLADPQGVAVIQQRAGELYAQLAAQDQEGSSVTFQPDFH